MNAPLKPALNEQFPPNTGDLPLASMLKSHPFTSGMAETQVKKLASLAHHVEFDEDQIVFQAGEKSRNFCLLVCGSACVEIRSPYYAICVQTLVPGDAFGWSSLLEEHHTVFQVRAREASSAIILDGKKLAEACRKDARLGSEIFRRLAQVVAKRVKATELRLAEFCGSVGPQTHNGQPSE